MFAGHFGLVTAVKAKAPKVPLWALMLSTQLLDVIFVPLLLSGAETLEPVAGEGYGGSLIHADYTHSLAGALLLAFVAGWGTGKLWGEGEAWRSVPSYSATGCSICSPTGPICLFFLRMQAAFRCSALAYGSSRRSVSRWSSHWF